MFNLIDMNTKSKKVVAKNLTLHQALAECSLNKNLKAIKKGSTKW